LIRTIDLNDYLGGNRIDGHPSDNIAVALSIDDWQRSTEPRRPLWDRMSRANVNLTEG
jgi:hypothetical protein